MMLTSEDPGPKTIGGISEDWYTAVLDGCLWRVDGRTIPTQEQERDDVALCYRLKDATVNRAYQRGLRLSGMVRSIHEMEPGKYEPINVVVPCLYLQSFERWQSIKDERWDRSRALPAPLFPPRATGPRGSIPPRMRGPAVDHTETIARLMDSWHGFSVAPKQLLNHPELKWYAAQCTCDTVNFRTHEVRCKAYPLLGLMELVVKRQQISPEEWVFGPADSRA